MNACPASCVTATDLIAMMWKGTSWPWMGSRMASLSRSTCSTSSGVRGVGTSATVRYATKSWVAPPLPPLASAFWAPMRRACVSRFFLSASAACFLRRLSSSLGPLTSWRVLPPTSTPPSLTLAALAFCLAFTSSTSSSSSSLMAYATSLSALVIDLVSTSGGAPAELTAAVSAIMMAHTRPLEPSLASSFTNPVRAICTL
mmetsp:Transcript_24154/g.59311  ORF Transcript_24154/g.59311 Transcript_24154/m.59311 type:complete len:201 (-) Transcript_24154:1439-2041(-)